MFDALSEQLEAAWKTLHGQDKISESNIQVALREVRRALLEADVNLQVAKQFIEEVGQKAQGASVISGVRPDQQFIKIVYDELVQLMGSTYTPFGRCYPLNYYPHGRFTGYRQNHRSRQTGVTSSEGEAIAPLSCHRCVPTSRHWSINDIG